MQSNKPEDPRVELRPWSVEDVELVRAASNDPFIAQMCQIPVPCDEAAASRWVAEQDKYSFVILARDCLEPIGGIGLQPDPAHYSAKIHYWLLGPRRGSGLATEAALLFSEWALQEFRVIDTIVSLRNRASWRVLEKAGFHRGARTDEFAGFRGPKDTYTYFRIR